MKETKTNQTNTVHFHTNKVGGDNFVQETKMEELIRKYDTL